MGLSNFNSFVIDLRKQLRDLLQILQYIITKFILHIMHIWYLRLLAGRPEVRSPEKAKNVYLFKPWLAWPTRFFHRA